MLQALGWSAFAAVLAGGAYKLAQEVVSSKQQQQEQLPPPTESGAGATGMGPGQQPVELASLLARAKAANTTTPGSVPLEFGLGDQKEQQQEQEQEGEATLHPQQARDGEQAPAGSVRLDEARLRDDVMNDLVQWEAPGTEATQSHVTGSGLHPIQAIRLTIEDGFDAAGGIIVSSWDAAGKAASGMSQRLSARAPGAGPSSHPRAATTYVIPLDQLVGDKPPSPSPDADVNAAAHISPSTPPQPAASIQVTALLPATHKRTQGPPSRHQLALLFGSAGLVLAAGGLVLGSPRLLPFSSLSLLSTRTQPRDDDQQQEVTHFASPHNVLESDGESSGTSSISIVNASRSSFTGVEESQPAHLPLAQHQNALSQHGRAMSRGPALPQTRAATGEAAAATAARFCPPQSSSEASIHKEQHQRADLLLQHGATFHQGLFGQDKTPVQSSQEQGGAENSVHFVGTHQAAPAGPAEEAAVRVGEEQV
ncbi:hypothetical protein DUNSADRAFT_16758 [Dunaliella salina]|uniref:Transmembrane protein n=1 Tax=Dunaliella salina TaxID=3046 RepID=A0ABQ7G2Z1_DUNSA|nr:hypothetical protein DUNSADRAFT_16758 [Dunaliella salina]|eukprot:KAF5828961.1 hypothetical protein DUNSADRAFT_16758 [Dunaliella salina]